MRTLEPEGIINPFGRTASHIWGFYLGCEPAFQSDVNAMKTLPYFLTLFGIIAITGCSSPRGGTADDYQYSSGTQSSTGTSDVYGFGTSGPTESLMNPTINARGAGAVPPATPP